MTILEILEVHHAYMDQTAVFQGCACGWGTEDDDHDEHLAEVLEQHMQEAKAEAWDRLVRYAPFTAFERVRLRCENPFREEPNDD